MHALRGRWVLFSDWDMCTSSTQKALRWRQWLCGGKLREEPRSLISLTEWQILSPTSTSPQKTYSCNKWWCGYGINRVFRVQCGIHNALPQSSGREAWQTIFFGLSFRNPLFSPEFAWYLAGGGILSASCLMLLTPVCFSSYTGFSVFFMSDTCSHLYN